MMQTMSGTRSMSQAYEALCRPDRPAGTDRDRKPLTAAALSLLVAGAGQLYNRQLFKALAIALVVYLLCGALGLAWLVLSVFLPESSTGWGSAIGHFFQRLGLAVPIVGGGLWLGSVVDAWRTAAALRAGRIVVRFSFRKQFAMAAAGFVPGAGLIIPSETCEAAATAGMSESELARHVALNVVKRKALSISKMVLAVVGMVPLIIGATIGSTALVVAGAMVVLIGLGFFVF
jgi:hypothetical protein